MSFLDDAMTEAKKALPGWAYAAIQKALEDDQGESEEVEKAESLAALCEWAAKPGNFPLEVEAAGEIRKAASVEDLRLLARWAFDRGSDLIATNHQNMALGITKADAYGDVASLVPSAGSRHPVVAFVGTHPSAIDAARGEPLAGPDGVVFAESYLAPLGLTKEDVLVTNILPVAGDVPPEELAKWVGWAKAELQATRPDVVVALGKVAKDELGDLAHFTMPHPGALRRLGDKGEVARKAKQIRERLEVIKADQREVSIAKADDESRIIVSVVLDPYIVDTQKDMPSPLEIQKTAHDYVAESRVVGLQHKTRAKATVVESWLWPYPSDEDYQKAMRGEPHRAYAQQLGNQLVHSGSWVMATRVEDEDTWGKIQRGEITGYSIGGTGVRTPMTREQMPKVEFIRVAS